MESSVTCMMHSSTFKGPLFSPTVVLTVTVKSAFCKTLPWGV